MYLRIDIVNKNQYETSENYKEIKILVPNDSIELEKDFKYLGLDYYNLDIQDTHIKECEFICKEDPDFSSSITDAINKLISRSSDLGYTTPFNYMKTFYCMINKFNDEDREKLLAILEAKKEQIVNINEAIKYANNIKCFELIDAYNNEELAKRLVYDGTIDIENLMEYADLERLGRDYAETKEIVKTQQGYLSQEFDFQKKAQEEEEEF